MIELGWTRDAVLDGVDAPFLDELRAAWDDCPPVRRMVAAYLGVKPKPKASKDFAALLAMFPGGKIRGRISDDG